MTKSFLAGSNSDRLRSHTITPSNPAALFFSCVFLVDGLHCQPLWVLGSRLCCIAAMLFGLKQSRLQPWCDGPCGDVITTSHVRLSHQQTPSGPTSTSSNDVIYKHTFKRRQDVGSVTLCKSESILRLHQRLPRDSYLHVKILSRVSSAGVDLSQGPAALHEPVDRSGPQ